MPERVPAASAGLSLMLAFGGKRADGSAFILSELVAAGTGASARRDGVDCLQTDGSNSMNLPIEALGIDAPMRVHPLRSARRLGRRRAPARGPRRGTRIRVRSPTTSASLIAASVISPRRAVRRAAGRAPCRAQRSIAPTAGSRRSSKCVTTCRAAIGWCVETAGRRRLRRSERAGTDAVAADVANRKVRAEAAAASVRYVD